jgi:hypothetical protein
LAFSHNRKDLIEATGKQTAAIEKQTAAIEKQTAAIEKQTAAIGSLAEKMSPRSLDTASSNSAEPSKPDSVQDELIGMINENCSNASSVLIDISYIDKHGLRHFDTKTERVRNTDEPILTDGLPSSSHYVLLEGDNLCLLYPYLRRMSWAVSHKMYFDAIYDGATISADLEILELIEPAKLRQDGDVYRVFEKGKVRCQNSGS